MSDADTAIADEINTLMKRMKITLSVIANSDDTAQRRVWHAQTYDATKEAESLHAKMTPTAQRLSADHMQYVTISALNCVDQLARALALEMDLDAIHARLSQDHVTFDTPGVEASRKNITSTLQQMQPWGKQLDEYLGTAFAVHDHQERLGGATSAERDARHDFLAGILDHLLSTKVDLSHAIVSLNAARLHSHELPGDLEQPLKAELPRQVMEAFQAFHEMGISRDPRERIDLCKSGSNALERLENTLDRIAEAAAEKWSTSGEDDSDPWQHALAFTDSLAALVSAISERLDLSVANARSLIAWQASQTQPAAQELPWAIVPDKPQTPAEASGSTSRSRHRRSRPTRAPAQTAAATAATAPVPDTRQLALKKANQLLKSAPVTMEMASDFNVDLLAIARGLKNDTTAIETMVLRGHDPMNISHSIRESAPGWFGDISALRSARDEVASLAKTRPDEELQTRIAQLGERIKALDLVDRRLFSDETDALKQHQFPKAKHLDRMLALDQIETVGAPVNLKPADNEGALFELKIRPRAFSNGDPAAPLYIHLHTHQQASGEQCFMLPFEQFTAVHVKTAKQKNQGRFWEQTQRQAGDPQARVHRARVEEPLWNALKNVARAQAN